MSINLGSAIAYMDLDSSKFSAGLGRVGKELQGFTDKSNSIGARLSSLGNVMKDVGGTMSKAFTLPIAAAGAAMVKTSMETEESMTKVNSILQLSKEEFGSYETTLKKGANEIGLAYDKYANAAYDAISAGVEQANVTSFLTDANKLAKGGLTDLTSATNLLTTVQNAYNLSQEDMLHVSDVLITTQNLGKVTVDELAASMGKIIPTANSLNVNVEQLGAGYAIMTAKGIASAEATTYMNSMFNELGKSGTGVDKILKQISGKSFAQLSEAGKTTGDVLGMLDEYAKKNKMSLSDLFGSAEAGKAAVTLLSNGVEGYNEKLDAMKNSTDATNKAFNEMNSTTKEGLMQSFDKLKNSLSDVGTAIEPLVDKIAEIISGFAGWLSKISETNPKLVQVGVVIAGVVAAIGPLLIGLGSLLGFLGFISTGMMALTGATTGLAAAMAILTSPITLTIAAVAALIAIGVLLYKNWDVIKAKAIEIWDAVSKVVSESITKMTEWISDKWNETKQYLSDTWDNIVKIGTDIWKGFKTSMSDMWNSIVETCVNTWNAIGLFFTETIPMWINNTIEWFRQLPYNIGYQLGELLGKIYNWGNETWTYLETNVPLWIESVGTYFSELPGRIWDYLSDVVQKVIDWGSQTLGSMKATGEKAVASIEEWVSTVPGLIWDWLVQAAQKVVDWGDRTYQSAKKAGEDTLNSIREWFSQVPGEVWNWLTQTLDKLYQWGSDMGARAKAGAELFVTNMVNGLKEAPGKVVSIGADIVNGIWNGIVSAKDWLAGKIKGFATGIVDGFKSALNIKSPSRVMAAEVGAHVPTGISRGIEQSMPKLQKTISESSKVVVKDYKSGMKPMTDVVKDMWSKNEKVWTEGSSKLKNLSKKQQEEMVKLEKNYTTNMHNIQVEYQDKVSDLNDKFKADQERLNTEYANILEKRTNTLMSWTNIFSEVKRDEEAASSWDLINNLEDQVNIFEQWADNMSNLKGKIGDALYNELLDQGPQAFQEIEAINKMTEEQLKRYEELYETKRKIAEAQAKKDTQADRDRINLEMENLKKTYDEKFLQLTTQMTEEVSKQINIVKDKFGTVPPAMLNMGKDSIGKFIEGIDSMRSSLYAAIDNLVSSANSRLSSINVEANISRSIIQPMSEDLTKSRVMALNLAKSNTSAKEISYKKSQPKDDSKDSPKKNEPTEKTYNFYNTYNSPKPTSIRDLKKQDEAQLRRLSMQFNL